MQNTFKRAMLFGALLLPGCTAMGQWLYDDPSFALRGVSLHPREGADSLELFFVACNLNDYEVTGDSFSTRLDVAGHQVGTGESERPVHIAVRDSTRFSVLIPVSTDALSSARSRVPFAIAASTALRTPIGTRRVDFRLKGSVRMVKEAYEWREEGLANCRPGTVALPPQFTDPIRPSRPGDQPRPTGVGDRP